MVKITAFLISIFMIWNVSFAQEAVGIHEIKRGEHPNEYIVKTTITGLEAVDLARATYRINDTHTYKKVLENELFSSRNKDYIKFYIMGVPETGTITVELGLTLTDNGAYSFPVEFQYSRNDVTKVVQFTDLVFKSEELVVSKNAVDVTIGGPDDEAVSTSNNSNMEESSLASPTTNNESISSVKKATKKEVIVLESTVIIQENPRAKEETIKGELANTKVKYTIQLLSLSKFSQARFTEYCEEHSLLEDEVSTQEVNGVTKVIYGKANSLEEAKKLIDKLKLLNNIDGAFVVPL
tara:strand:- start:273 stop:1157 length:885 start_codon:yes stop_codon:yes gene_type:complete